MALHKKGKWSYGDAQIDIREALGNYSARGYPVQHFADSVCACRNKLFFLEIDEDEGAAVRRCISCDTRHPIGDSGDYLAEAELDECTCICGKDKFEVTVGVALYEGSEDVKWIYIGCRCVFCGLVGCYGDWKNEFGDYREFLTLI